MICQLNAQYMKELKNRLFLFITLFMLVSCKDCNNKKVAHKQCTTDSIKAVDSGKTLIAVYKDSSTATSIQPLTTPAPRKPRSARSASDSESGGNNTVIPDSGPALPTICSVDPDSSLLSMRRIPQEQDGWCWAASAQMVLEKLGNTVGQCEQADKQLGRRDCCEVPLQCNTGGWPHFEEFGFDCDTTQSFALSWEVLKRQIDCDTTPFCMTWRWIEGDDPSDTSGHVMVVSGYKIDGGRQMVKILDPDRFFTHTPISGWIPYDYYVGMREFGWVHWDDYYNVKKKIRQ